MRKYIYSSLFFLCSISWAQTDFSSNWEDFYSYNNVKDFIKVNSKIYAIADNAVFIYDTDTQEVEKLSSVNGLFGKRTSSIFFNETFQRLVIGYDTGLIEIVDIDGKINISNDIERLSITGEKSINHIAEYDNKLYLSTPFAIVVYDIESLQFEDTYFIGNGSSEVYINQIEIFEDKIYAATELGIFVADVDNPNLIDFNNWQQPFGEFIGNFRAMESFNNEILTTRDGNFYRISSPTTLQFVNNLSETILDLKGSDEYIVAVTSKKAHVFDKSLVLQVVADITAEFNFTLQSAYAEDFTIYLGTTEFGILQRSFSNAIEHTEIHPEGPTLNDVFSITADNNNLWVVYGGYSAPFTPLQSERDISHFNGENWINIPYNPAFPARDLVNVTIDPNHENKVYISSWGQTDPGNLNPTGGILVVENDKVTTFLNQKNSDLEDLAPENPNYISIRINGTAFDNQGNLWVANAWIDNRLKKLSTNGIWSSFDLSSIITTGAFGLTELIVDRVGNIFIGSRFNGLLAFNETGNRKKALTTEFSKGSLPDLAVRSVVADRNNRIWIGTKKGLVVFSNASGLFETNNIDAAPVIIDDDGIPKKLLGDQAITTIAIDGADNKWFGSETGGVLGTNPSGQETLFNFNKDNSPLPSNRIIKIKVDDSNGKVFFATNQGIVAFKNNVAPFGDSLGEVYAYPNPVKKEHSFVTIDGRNDTNLPRGTNVKILDASGRLVHETNVIEGQELKGGKVVWDKTNLAGRKVASGIYIVLLTLPDKSETSMTKIAIIN
jgi:hypothetical protein